MNFYFHKEPADGFYCIYRKRSTENTSSCGLPDCPNITATLTRHANMLVSAGTAFIVADSTNIPSVGSAADALQLRPFEVVGEEWKKLRAQNISTPQITIWQNLQNADGNLYKEYLKIYRDPEFSDLIYRDPHTGKQVFFATADPLPAQVAEIEAEGDIVVVVMWAERDNFAKGEFAFFSPCIDPVSNASTSTVSNTAACNQHHTTNAKIGSHGTAVTVGPSYQVSYASLPWMAAGTMGGLTLKNQFQKAFALNAAGGLDYLMVGTFNEHIAQPQPNPYSSNPAAISMGMENDVSTHKRSVFYACNFLCFFKIYLAGEEGSRMVAHLYSCCFWECDRCWALNVC